MSGKGKVAITVVWLNGDTQLFDLDLEVAGGVHTGWAWRYTMKEGIPLLIIRPRRGLRFEIPLGEIKFIQVDTGGGESGMDSSFVHSVSNFVSVVDVADAIRREGDTAGGVSNAPEPGLLSYSDGYLQYSPGDDHYYRPTTDPHSKKYHYYGCAEVLTFGSQSCTCPTLNEDRG